MRSGLLQALGTRYATFHFTDVLIFLHVLPYGSNDVCSFFLPRREGRNPSADFSRMAEILGKLWWNEQTKTRKRHLASHHILNLAMRNQVTSESVKPPLLFMPDVKQASLTHLNIEKIKLTAPEIGQTIREAYRRQVKLHHPDLGGNAAMFRNVHEAYEDLLDWLNNPQFVQYRGFPDKWFYEGGKNRWIQPSPQRSRISSQKL